MTEPFIYLASKSPRRAELLSQIGVKFELLLADATENAEALEDALANENPSAYVGRVTLNKLNAAIQRHLQRALPIAPVLTSDTTVAIGGTLLGKPSDADQARAMLCLLSGRTHRVITAVGLASGTLLQRKKVILQTSRVTFARLPAHWIDSYIESKEPFDKAGGYGIQGAIGAFVKRIEGSYSGIMGLPLYETAKLLGIQHAHRQRNSDQSHEPRNTGSAHP
jgi:septum formation protein